ncbi:hypothetical protein V6Z11_A09G154700 [Gossypium hirsutum]
MMKGSFYQTRNLHLRIFLKMMWNLHQIKSRMKRKEVLHFTVTFVMQK